MSDIIAGPQPSTSPLRRLIRNLLRVPPLCDAGTWLAHVLVNRLRRLKPGVFWPVHITSRVIRPERVKLGYGSYPGDMPGCYIQAINGIEIGDEVLFAPGIGLISANHDVLTMHGHLPAPPIRIGDRSWIGMNAVILPGVCLGPHTVVGAGAVVTKSFPQGYCVLGGNPARVIKQLTPEDFSDYGR